MSGTLIVHLVIRGRVQGVGFRAWTQHQGELRGLTGWVRNRRDGSVEAHLEGPPDAVAELVLWCRSGPPHATVEDLLVTAAEPAGFDRFAIRG